MDLLEHFACYTHLPVKLADVKAQILDTGRVDQIYRYRVDIDPEILRGIFRLYHHKPPYAPAGGLTVAEIIYSGRLPPYEARIVQVKEMLHVFDKEAEMAAKMEQVQQLAEDIIVPMEVLLKLGGSPSRPVLSDRSMIFPALAVLLPRDFLDEVRPLYKTGRVSPATIAQAAQVPTEYVRFALRDDWQEILDSVI